MVEVIQFIVALTWIALVVAFLLGMINPQIVTPSHKKMTRADILIFYLFIPTVLILIGIFGVVIFQDLSSNKYDRILGVVILTIVLLTSLIIIGLIRPKYVIHWGNLRNRTKVLLYYGVPILLLVGIMALLRPTMIANDRRESQRQMNTFVASTLAEASTFREGTDCGAYYAKNWGKSVSWFVDDSFQHIASYKRCDVYLETIKTSWGTLYRGLIFIDRRLEAMEMVASSNSLSLLELNSKITKPCFIQHGNQIQDRTMPQLTWSWQDPYTEVRTFAFARRANDNSVYFFVGHGGPESEISTYFAYLGRGATLSLEVFLGVRSG